MLLEAFQRFLTTYEDSAESWEIMEDIITLRASFLIDQVLAGLQIDFDHALDLLRKHNSFSTEREKQEHDIIVAAIDNLVDFAVAEEMAMMNELPHEKRTENLELCKDIFKKYNDTYAKQENEDVLYAAIIAAWWLNLPDNSLVTYMTQGDERVRAWHLSHEGATYKKNEFPEELIPPIEWGCRCFLISGNNPTVMASIAPKAIHINTNPIFKESLAKGGRIFSDAHPYFSYTLKPQCKMIKQRLKTKFYLDEDNN